MEFTNKQEERMDKLIDTLVGEKGDKIRALHEEIQLYSTNFPSSQEELVVLIQRVVDMRLRELKLVIRSRLQRVSLPQDMDLLLLQRH